MKLAIEDFTSFTGFVASHASVTFPIVNEYPDMIAGNELETSLVFRFNGAQGKYFEKVFAQPIDVTDFKEIVFSIFSREFRGAGYEMKRPDDFKYKIDFGGADEFFIPLGMNFADVTLWLNGITSISRIRVTALHNDDDYIFMSNMVAVKDELPLDIFRAVKEKLDFEIAKLYPDGLLIGTVSSAASGAKQINIAGAREFIDKYSIVKIKDGSGEELVELDDNDEGTYKLSPNFNDGELVNSYTNALVYLQFYTRFGTSQDEVVLPSISIWGMTPEPILRGGKIQSILDTYKVDGTLTERRDAQIQLYKISLNIESRWNEINATIAQIVRDFLAREQLFINGRRYEITSSAVPEEITPVEAINDIFILIYEMGIEVKEDIGLREVLEVTSVINRTITMSRV